MKNIKYVKLITGSILFQSLLLTGCSSDSIDSDISCYGKGVTMSGSLPDAGTRASGNKWNANDKIGVFVSGRKNMPYLLSEGNGSFYGNFDYAGTDSGFDTDGNAATTYSYQAYYPYIGSEGSDVSESFDSSIQTSVKDYLAASVNESGDNKLISFQFSHLLSKLILVIQTQFEITDFRSSTFSLSGLKWNGSFTANASGASVNASGNIANNKEIPQWALSNNGKNRRTYELLLPPQTPTGGKLTLNVDNVTQGLRTVNYQGEFPLSNLEKGKVYTVTLTLTGDGIMLHGNQISDWTKIADSNVTLEVQ